MNRFVAAIAALGLSCIVVSGAAAHTYGTSDGGCEQAAGNPVSGTAVYFDGNRMGGQDWECTLTPVAGDTFVGLCEGEGGDPPVLVTFTIVFEGDSATVSSDAQEPIYILKRCQHR